MKGHIGFCKRVLGVSLALVLMAGAVPSVEGQERENRRDRNDRRRAEELKSVYKKWIDEDVAYIITNDERRAFRALKTDEERDQFIEQFWLRRDQDPDTPENEYREEYYQRIQYANEKFSSGIPGWKTDRGRIYIMFGKADQVESHPAGGPYERPYWEGGGTTTTYPFEIWWYRHIEGIGSDIEIEFVDPSGTGEYRIARSPYEKDALLYVPNAGLTLAESLGLVNKADRIAMGGMWGNEGGSRGGQIFGARAKDQPFERLALWADLQRPPAIKFPDLQVRADLPEVAADILPFSVRTDFMRISSDAVVTSFTMQFDHGDLAFKNIGGIYSSGVNIYARIRSLAGRSAGIFEDTVQSARYTEEQLAVAQTQQSLYQKKVVLPPGRYKIDVVSRDITSGKTGILYHSFEVPRYQDNQLATSTLVLAASVEPLDNMTIPSSDMFIFGRYKVKPHMSGTYRPGQNLALFLQVYDAQMDQATLQPAIKVEYVISKGGQEIMTIVEDGTSQLGLMDLRGQQLTVARAIPITDRLAEAGTYTVTARITDLVSRKVVTPQAQFTVVNR